MNSYLQADVKQDVSQAIFSTHNRESRKAVFLSDHLPSPGRIFSFRDAGSIFLSLRGTYGWKHKFVAGGKQAESDDASEGKRPRVPSEIQ